MIDHRYPNIVYSPAPPDVPPLDDLSNGLEFSELGRAPMGWAGVALVFAAIALPLFGVWLIWGRH